MVGKKYEGNKYIKRFKGEKGNRVGGKKEGKKEEKGRRRDCPWIKQPLLTKIS